MKLNKCECIWLLKSHVNFTTPKMLNNKCVMVCYRLNDVTVIYDSANVTHYILELAADE